METATKNKLQAFGVFCNLSVGTKVKAKDINDLFENRMTKKQKKFWSHLMFKDEQDRTITVTREFLEQGLTLQEVIEDWITHCPEMLDEKIYTV